MGLSGANPRGSQLPLVSQRTNDALFPIRGIPGRSNYVECTLRYNLEVENPILRFAVNTALRVEPATHCQRFCSVFPPNDHNLHSRTCGAQQTFTPGTPGGRMRLGTTPRKSYEAARAS